MLFPESQSRELDPALFANPTGAYRGIPFWSWNCTVTEELIDHQLDVFKAMGFGGVDIHPRSGLNIPYLGDTFMHLVRYAVDRCKEKGLICWLYDDDRFPSGAAGGLVTRERRFRQRCLLLTETPRTNFLATQEAFDQALAQGKAADGWFAAAYAVGEKTVRRISTDRELLHGEHLRYAYVMLLEDEAWFQGQTYADVMNPKAVRAFLNITHEAYARLLGDDLGHAVPAIFTDEPRMETRTNQYAKQLNSEDAHHDVILPWSETLRERFMQEQGLDLLDVVPALLWEMPESPQMRYYFRNAASEQFTSAFMDQLAEWCSGHGISLTGHVLGEDSLLAQSASLGDCMRCYRRMDIPGIDVLCDERQFLAAKQAASVAHQMQREGVVSELYGVTQWNCDFATFKLQGDWQAALGVNIRVPHLSWMSMEGEAKRDWPGSIFEQAPWWREFSSVEDYFARLNTVLTRGQPLIDVAVLHPVESMWLHQGSLEKTLKIRQEMSNDFDCLIKSLLANLTDFDLLAESLLPQQNPFCDESGLHVGAMTYRTVIVPDMETIRSTTLDVLEQFQRLGGRIVFAGQVPTLVNASPSERGMLLARQCEHADSLVHLNAMMDECQPLGISKKDGCKAENLLCQCRQDGDTRWVFLCQAWPKKERQDCPEEYVLRIHGHWRITCYDALNGSTYPLHGWQEDGDTLLPWCAYAQDSLLLRLTPGVMEFLPSSKKERQLCTRLVNPVSITTDEKNMMLLDYACASLDGENFTAKEEILRLDNQLRRQLGFKLRFGSMMQPYALEKKETHQLTLRYEIDSEMDAQCDLALEHPECCTMTLNGEWVDCTDRGWNVDRAIRKIRLPMIHPGTNLLEIHLPYHQKTNLENLYLLGDFDVLPHPAGKSTLIQRRSKLLGDLTRQGMPFYSGKVYYHFSFTASECGEYTLSVPDFAAALLIASVDDKPIGQIAYAPYRLSLGKLTRGEHSLLVTAFIGRHNGFAYLHNQNDHFVWYGPDAWRTQGDEWTDGYRVLPVGVMGAVEIWRE